MYRQRECRCEFDPTVVRHTSILLSHAALDFHRAPRCIDRTGELLRSS